MSTEKWLYKIDNELPLIIRERIFIAEVFVDGI
jgi:hypothetical protein